MRPDMLGSPSGPQVTGAATPSEAICRNAIQSCMTVPQDQFLDPRVEGRYVIRTDPHCHILPGLDDGSPSLKMSLRMARRMAALGIQNAVATPHGVHPGIDTNVDPDFLREQVDGLNQALTDEGIPLRVFPGTEIFLRRRIMNQFDNGRLLTWADQGRFILVELGFQRKSGGVLEVIDHFIAAGLTPIIAHPERYLWLPEDVSLFVELRDRGCIFQFNTMSINGHFGPRTRDLAMRLLPHAGSFIVGTDSHHDADRYFDFDDVKAVLNRLNLIDDSGLVTAGKSDTIPDLLNLTTVTKR